MCRCAKPVSHVSARLIATPLSRNHSREALVVRSDAPPRAKRSQACACERSWGPFRSARLGSRAAQNPPGSTTRPKLHHRRSPNPKRSRGPRHQREGKSTSPIGALRCALRARWGTHERDERAAILQCGRLHTARNKRKAGTMSARAAGDVIRKRLPRGWSAELKPRALPQLKALIHRSMPEHPKPSRH